MDSPGWLRMGLDIIAVDVARGRAGVEVVAIGGDVSYCFVCLQKPHKLLSKIKH